MKYIENDKNMKKNSLNNNKSKLKKNYYKYIKKYKIFNNIIKK